MRRSRLARGHRKQLSASSAADGRPPHQQPRPRRWPAVFVADFCNKIGHFRTHAPQQIAAHPSPRRRGHTALISGTTQGAVLRIRVAQSGRPAARKASGALAQTFVEMRQCGVVKTTHHACSATPSFAIVSCSTAHDFHESSQLLRGVAASCRFHDDRAHHLAVYITEVLVGPGA